LVRVRFLGGCERIMCWGFFCCGVTVDVAIQCFLKDSCIGIGQHLHVRDDGVIVAVNDGDFEQVDVAQVWLDVGMTW